MAATTVFSAALFRICCNKLPGIRAALCLDLFVAEIARANNNANVLVTGAKVVAPDYAELILERWVATSFRGERHAERVAMIAALERGELLLQRAPWHFSRNWHGPVTDTSEVRR